MDNNCGKVMRIDEESDYEQQLPDEIIAYILSYLPQSSLFGVKSVCKLWNTMFLHPDFSYLYELHIMICGLELDDMTYSLTDGDAFYNMIGQSSQGLSLERTTTTDASFRYRVKCPVTLQRLAIPSPQNPTLCIALDFVPSKSAIKLVSVHEDENHSLHYEILTLGIASDQASYCWRGVKVPPTPNLQQSEQKRKRRIQVFFRKAVAYCISYVENPGQQEDDDDLTDIEVDVLDMVNESYIGRTTLPRGYGFFSKLSLSKTKLMDWNGRLSFAELVKDELHVLVLHDYRNLKWDERRPIIKLKFLKPDNKEIMIFYTRVDTMLYFVSQDRKSFCGYDIDTGKLVTTNFMSKINSGEEVAEQVARLTYYRRAHQLRMN